MQTAGLTRMALTSRSTGSSQKPPQALAVSVRSINERVDGLVTDGFTIIAMASKISCNCSKVDRYRSPRYKPRT